MQRYLIFSHKGKELPGFQALRNRVALFNPRADKIREAVSRIEGLVQKQDKELENLIRDTDKKILEIKKMRDPEQVNNLVDEILNNLEKLKSSLAKVKDLDERRLSSSSISRAETSEVSVLDPSYKHQLRSDVIAKSIPDINANIEALTDEIIRRAARYSEKLAAGRNSPRLR